MRAQGLFGFISMLGLVGLLNVVFYELSSYI